MTDPSGIVPLDGPVKGDAGDDILAGDTGGSTAVQKDANIVLVLDVSLSMYNEWIDDGNGGSIRRLTAMKNGVIDLLNDLASSSSGQVLVHIVKFDTDASHVGTYNVKDNGELQDAIDNVDDLNAGSYTNYEAGLQKALDWVNGTGPLNKPGYTNTVNQVIFVSDGLPNRWYRGETGTTVNGSGADYNATAREQFIGTYSGSDPQDHISEVFGLESVFGPVEAVGIQLSDDPSAGNGDGVPGSETPVDVLDDVEGFDGSADNIQTANQLSDVLQDLSPLYVLKDTGSDIIDGGYGDDVIFGDVIYTDTLAQDMGITGTRPGAGWEVFEQLEAGSGWDRSDSLDYINNPAHHEELAKESLNPDGTHRAGGDDTIDGGSGADTIYGQEGDDILIYDSADTVVDGGSGIDTLRLRNGDDISFASMPPSSLSDIEIIDLRTDTMANALTGLAIDDVQAMTDSMHNLYIHGGAGDSVTLAAGWTQITAVGVYEQVWVNDVVSQTVTLFMDLV